MFLIDFPGINNKKYKIKKKIKGFIVIRILLLKKLYETCTIILETWMTKDSLCWLYFTIQNLFLVNRSYKGETRRRKNRVTCPQR